MDSIQDFSRIGDQKLFRRRRSRRRNDGDAICPLRRAKRAVLTRVDLILGYVSRLVPVDRAHPHWGQSAERLLLSNPIPGQPDESTFQVVLDTCPTRSSTRIEALDPYQFHV